MKSSPGRGLYRYSQWSTWADLLSIILYAVATVIVVMSLVSVPDVYSMSPNER
jgi:hypothetical protein